jgi:hypothetical protein
MTVKTDRIDTRKPVPATEHGAVAETVGYFALEAGRYTWNGMAAKS